MTFIFKTMGFREGPVASHKIFLDEQGPVDLARFDVAKYPIFQKQAETMDSMVWKPTEINLAMDKIDYMTKLNDVDRFVFTHNLQRQILADSYAGRGLEQALGFIVSDPHVESCIKSICYFENRIHARSYTHILQNLFQAPTEVFDGIKNNEEFIVCAEEVSKYCDDLIKKVHIYQHTATLLEELKANKNCTEELIKPYKKLFDVRKKAVKKALYLYLVSLNAMEGVLFYVSFTRSLAFGQTKRMMGNSSIIQLIANDEAIHVAFTTALIRILPEDDTDFIAIYKECEEEAIEIFMHLQKSEYLFNKFLFSKGSMLGLNEEMMNRGVDWRVAKCMKNIRLPLPLGFEPPKHDPFEWMKSWMNEEDIQTAPQDTEVTSYLRGVEGDTDETTFDGFEL